MFHCPVSVECALIMIIYQYTNHGVYTTKLCGLPVSGFVIYFHLIAEELVVIMDIIQR